MKRRKAPVVGKQYKSNGKIKTAYHEDELARLQGELVKLQYWIKEQDLRVVIILEGRDAAGQGRDGVLQSQLVQPGRCGMGDGFLHRA